MNLRKINLGYFKGYENRYVEDAFWIFVHIAYVTNYRGIYQREFPKLREMMNSFSERLETKAPSVFNHIKEKEVPYFYLNSL